MSQLKTFLPGTVIKNWVIVGPSVEWHISPGGYRHSCSMCECIKCHDVYKVTNYSLRNSRTGQCKTCGNRKEDSQSSSVKTLFGSLRGSARQRNLEVTITLDQFKSIIIKPCYFNFFGCVKLYAFSPYFYKNGNKRPSRSTMTLEHAKESIIMVSGVDRLNNDLGYIAGNCVPCCPECNYKKNNYSILEFLADARMLLSRETELIELYNSTLSLKDNP